MTSGAMNGTTESTPITRSSHKYVI
jgi:hypothetical protein